MRTTLLLARAVSAPPGAPWAGSSLFSQVLLGSAPILGMCLPLAPQPLPSRNGSSIYFYSTSVEFALPGRLSQIAVLCKAPALWRSVIRGFRWILCSIMGRISVRPKARS